MSDTSAAWLVENAPCHDMPELEEKNKAANQAATAVGAWDWGVMLAARHFWQQLGVQEIIDSQAKNRGLG